MQKFETKSKTVENKDGSYADHINASFHGVKACQIWDKNREYIPVSIVSNITVKGDEKKLGKSSVKDKVFYFADDGTFQESEELLSCVKFLTDSIISKDERFDKEAVGDLACQVMLDKFVVPSLKELIEICGGKVVKEFGENVDYVVMNLWEMAPARSLSNFKSSQSVTPIMKQVNGKEFGEIVKTEKIVVDICDLFKAIFIFDKPGKKKAVSGKKKSSDYKNNF